MVAVLGLHAYSHDAGAAVVTDDGVWALAEERLSRRKYDGEFPARSIRWALEAAGLASPADVDLVVFDLLGEGHAARIESDLREVGFVFGDGRSRLLACRHHDAHAASAFYPSPFDDAAVLVIDAGGTKLGDAGPGCPRALFGGRLPYAQEAQTLYRGTPDGLRCLRRTVMGDPYTINPGVLYGVSAMHLGFGPMGAGQVMGLAPFGRVDVDAPPFFEDLDGDPLASSGGPFPWQGEAFRRFCTERLFGGVPPRAEGEPLSATHEDLAAWVQHQCESAVLRLVRHLADVTGCPRLCVAGGFGLNAVTNRRILESTSFEELWIQPAATDTGASLGCALWGWHEVLKRSRRYPMESAALGGSYSAADVDAALAALPAHAAAELDVSRPADLSAVAATALDEGAIVGWFQGRSEYGPRALGQRSVLGDPRRPETVTRLNADIKRRAPFRPYAPVVLERRAAEFFDLPTDRNPFMLLIAPVREGKRAALPAVTHVDGSARAQTVAEGTALGGLLAAFEARTGVPVLLNTSFNRGGEPIVETPADALDMFLATGLDALAIGQHWIAKRHLVQGL